MPDRRRKQFTIRRWLRFSVRTLLVAVTIFCVWLGWQVSIVRERSQLVSTVRWIGGQAVPLDEIDLENNPCWEPLRVSAIRTLLGDQGWYSIELNDPASPDLLEQVATAFPEADINISTEQGSTPYRDRLIPIDEPSFLIIRAGGGLTIVGSGAGEANDKVPGGGFF